MQSDVTCILVNLVGLTTSLPLAAQEMTVLLNCSDTKRHGPTNSTFAKIQLKMLAQLLSGNFVMSLTYIPRDRLLEGKPIDDLCPPAVAQYIYNNKITIKRSSDYF